jgi:hypothetical protein
MLCFPYRCHLNACCVLGCGWGQRYNSQSHYERPCGRINVDDLVQQIGKMRPERQEYTGHGFSNIGSIRAEKIGCEMRYRQANGIWRLQGQVTASGRKDRRRTSSECYRAKT